MAQRPLSAPRAVIRAPSEIDCSCPRLWKNASYDGDAFLGADGEVFGVIRPAIGLGEFCPRRAGVVVVLGVVDEVLPGEEAAFGPARGQGLGHDRRDAGAFAREDLVTAKVAAVRQGGDLLAARGL